MRFITWNIDGLDKEGLFERTLELIPILAGFDVIFLQEVTDEVEEIIKSKAANEQARNSYQATCLTSTTTPANPSLNTSS